MIATATLTLALFAAADLPNPLDGTFVTSRSSIEIGSALDRLLPRQLANTTLTFEPPDAPVAVRPAIVAPRPVEAIPEPIPVPRELLRAAPRQGPANHVFEVALQSMAAMPVRFVARQVALAQISPPVATAATELSAPPRLSTAIPVPRLVERIARPPLPPGAAHVAMVPSPVDIGVARPRLVSGGTLSMGQTDGRLAGQAPKDVVAASGPAAATSGSPAGIVTTTGSLRLAAFAGGIPDTAPRVMPSRTLLSRPPLSSAALSGSASQRPSWPSAWRDAQLHAARPQPPLTSLRDMMLTGQ